MTSSASPPASKPTDAPASAPLAPAREQRVALVTGAARRLGREIALSLAREGWDVAVHFGLSAQEAQDTAAEIRSMGRRAQCFGADLADPARTGELFAAVVASMGSVTCLVNSASRFEHDTPATFDPHTLNAHLAPNLAAPLLLSRCLFDALPAGEQGVIINLLDQKLDHPNPDFFSYTLSKSALLAATRMMALAFAPRVRVVGVSPGLTLPAPGQSRAAFEKVHAIAPLGRASSPQDICAAVRFAVNTPSVTGINIVVDGGQHLMGLQRDFFFLAQDHP